MQLYQMTMTTISKPLIEFVSDLSHQATTSTIFLEIKFFYKFNLNHNNRKHGYKTKHLYNWLFWT